MTDYKAGFSGSDSPDEDEMIELVDEDGTTTLFDHLATLEYESETYLVLSDPQLENEENCDVIIMQIAQDENGQDIYIRPDEKVEEAVFELFLSMLDDMENEEE